MSPARAGAAAPGSAHAAHGRTSGAASPRPPLPPLLLVVLLLLQERVKLLPLDLPMQKLRFEAGCQLEGHTP